MTARNWQHPFSWHGADEGWRRLFDLSVLAGSLELRPLDRVLDLGCGWGGASEWLLRMGCHVVALDPEEDRLVATGRRCACDERLASLGAPWRLAARAERLPLADAAFDAVLCLHALHHMADRSAVFGELSRVLKPGAAAAFAEPGAGHDRSREAELHRRRTGEREDSLDLELLRGQAMAAGFSSMAVLPLPYPKDAVMAYEGREALGRSWERSRRGGWARWLVHDYRPFFLLRKEGEPGRDSRRAENLNGRLRAGDESPPWQEGEGVAPGQSLALRLRACNTGKGIWRRDLPPSVGSVRLGLRWFSPEGRLLVEGAERVDLSRPLEPGEEEELSLEIVVPDLPSGALRLRVELVSEYVAWFGDLEGRNEALWERGLVLKR